MIQIVPSGLARLTCSMKNIKPPIRWIAASGASPVYELRTYNLVAKEFGQFLSLSKDKFHLRTSHSVLLGYWTTELGGLNQVVHLWQYDSYAHRAGVRARLGRDQEWQSEYFQKILPWLQHQNNLTLTSMIEPVVNTGEGGTYELWQFCVPGDNQNWNASLLDLTSSLQDDGTTLCGAFSSVFGPMGSTVLIWRHQDLDKAPALQQQLLHSEKGKQLFKNVISKNSKILAPTIFSPWK